MDQVTSTAYELERLGGELAAQRETLWAPLGGDLIAAVAAGLQTHSADARCLAFKLLVSTGLNRATQGGGPEASVGTEEWSEAGSSAAQERLVDGNWGFDDNGRWGRVKEAERGDRRSVFDRLSGPPTSQNLVVSHADGRDEREGSGRSATETGLWLRAKLTMDGTETQYGPALGKGDWSSKGGAKLAEGVFDVSRELKDEAQAKRQYLWLAATEVEQMNVVLDQQEGQKKIVSGSSAIVHVLRAAGLREVAVLLRDRERLQKTVDALPEGAGVPLLVVAGCTRAEWVETEPEEGAEQDEGSEMENGEQQNGRKALEGKQKEGMNGWELDGDMEDGSEKMKDGTNGTITGMELVPVGSVGDDVKGDVSDDVAGAPRGEWDESDEDGAEAALGEALGLDELGVDDGRLGEWRVVFVGDTVRTFLAAFVFYLVIKKRPFGSNQDELGVDGGRLGEWRSVFVGDMVCD